MSKFMKKYANAKKAIAQIRAGEWVPYFNSIAGRNLTASRGGLELWIGNGGWFCEIKQGDYFGWFWRHYVWWAAARHLPMAGVKPPEIPEL